jgi:hypothetical protein
MFTCKTKKKVVVGYFDENTRVLGAERYYVIQKKSNKTGKWVRHHYYSHFSDMLRAYVRMLMLVDNSTEEKKSILQLLDKILEWDQKIENLGQRLQNEWKNINIDPVVAKETNTNARSS